MPEITCPVCAANIRYVAEDVLPFACLACGTMLHHPEAGFLHAIIENPLDDTPRRAYPDWVHEHGQPDRAEFIRLQYQLAALGPSRQLIRASELPGDTGTASTVVMCNESEGLLEEDVVDIWWGDNKPHSDMSGMEILRICERTL